MQQSLLQMSSNSKFEELHRRLAKVHENTRSNFAERAKEMHSAIDRLNAGDQEARDALRRLAHKLRGVAGNVGHEELGERAARLEKAIKRGISDLALLEGARRLAKATLDASASAPAESKPSMSTPDRPSSAPLGWQVLAIDDDRSTRKLLQLTFRSAGGCHIDVLANPIEAISLVRQNKYRLVVVDAMMPEMNGNHFYHQIRLFSNVPIVILSAATADELGWAMPPDAALHWLRKPFRPHDLIKELRTFIKRVDASDQDAESPL